MTADDVLDPSTVEPTPSTGSGTLHVDVTAELGCTKMRSRLWYLDPGDALNLHRQAEQEELYVVIEGPGRLRLEDEVLDVPEGALVRVPPETKRQVRNDTEAARHVWLIVGAPPVEGHGRPLPEAGE